MANRIWRGDAPEVAQVTTGTPTAANSTAYTLTVNGKNITFTSDSSATVAEITAGLVTAWNASVEPEFEEVTAADATTTFTLTADTPGKPFTVTSTGAGTISLAATTASSGPNHWGLAANWTGAAVPVAADDVIIEDSDVDILWDLDQNTVTLTSLTIKANYTGKIGLPLFTDTDYYEYREDYLKISATTVNIGEGIGEGSQRIKLHTGTNATTIHVHQMAAPVSPSLEALLLNGSHASNVLNAYQGTIGVAVLGGETANFPTLRVGYQDNKASDAQVRCGADCLLATIEKSGGTLEYADAATLNQSLGGGTTTIMAGAHTVNADGGTVFYRSASALVLIASNDAVIDFTQDMRVRTVTTCDLYGEATLLDPYKTCTFSAGIDLNETTLNKVTLDLGTNLRLTPGAVA